jgi:hypothetical protein
MRLDVKITAALVLAIVIETCGVMLWTGAQAQRLDEMEARLDLQRPVAERLARLETQVANAQASLDRIERRLDAR